MYWSGAAHPRAWSGLSPYEAEVCYQSLWLLMSLVIRTPLHRCRSHSSTQNVHATCLYHLNRSFLFRDLRCTFYRFSSSGSHKKNLTTAGKQPRASHANNKLFAHNHQHPRRNRMLQARARPSTHHLRLLSPTFHARLHAPNLP